MPYTYCNWLWLFNINIKDSIDCIKKYVQDNSICLNDLNKDNIHNILYNNKIDFNILIRMKNSLNILKEKDRNTDIKTYEFVLENYKNKRLFFTENHLAPPLVFHISKQFLKLLDINIEINENENIGCYNTNVFWPISSYINKILNLEYESDSMGDDFYINYFYDYINNMDINELYKKYNLYENNEMYSLPYYTDQKEK